MTEIVELITEMETAIAGAPNADAAWAEVVAISKRGGEAIPAEIESVDSGAESKWIARQLTQIFGSDPLPAGLTFLYFGLFAGVGPSGEDLAGFYVSGGTSENVEPVIESPDDLTYLPEKRFLSSALLQLIRVEALGDARRYDFFDYALMFAAAALLAKFALRELGLDKVLIVGFDSGDSAIIR